MTGTPERATKYMIISAEIRQSIITGELAPGDAIPSLREIADKWGVSKTTAERVHTILKNDGLVEIRQGAQASVKANIPIFRRIQERAVESVKHHSVLRADETEKISVNITANAPEFVQQDLEIGAQDSVIARGRITRRGGNVVELSTTYFRAEVAKKAPLICGEDNIMAGSQKYVAEQLGLTVDGACEYSSVRHATDTELEQFEAEGPLPVMEVRHVLSANDEPFCVTLLLGPPGYQHKICYDVGSSEPTPTLGDTHDES